ncbi:hypothetical protein [Streptomyces sp. B6B3]|uniref:hypothetical protein n=1 Tax=Streptomyces sp. B6B3 TaxID=3153570 RepID=UPI00325CCB94
MDDLTPEQLGDRAEKLREAATRARELAGSLGEYLDSAVTKATGDDPSIWTGPYAEEASGHLRGQQTTLRAMASSLLADATRWENEAGQMDDEAGSREDDEGGN